MPRRAWRRPRVAPCEECGRPFGVGPRGPVPRRCSRCREADRLAKSARAGGGLPAFGPSAAATAWNMVPPEWDA